MSAFREQFEAAYRSAVYRVHFPDDSSEFRVGRAAVPTEPFGIVTAFNPPGTARSASDNLRANELLLARIQSAGWRHLASLASAPDGTHAEPGFAVFGVEAVALLALAREFGQAAVAWFDGRTLEVLWTDEATSR